MARMAKEAMAAEKIDVLADRGYFGGGEVLACEAICATPHVTKPLTSNANAAGRFGKDDFVYLADQNAYRCPADPRLTEVHDALQLAPALVRRAVLTQSREKEVLWG